MESLKFKDIKMSKTERDKKKFKEMVDQKCTNLMFIIDATSSMQEYIDEAKASMHKIIQEVKMLQQNHTVKVAIVSYRDDVKNPEKYETLSFVQIEKGNLTEQIQPITEFLSNLKAQGGADPCEDVIGGMKLALELITDLKGLLLTFFIADHPSHGKWYHDLGVINDNNYEDIPKNSLETLMSQYRKKHSQQFFCCLKLTKENDKMYDIMSKHYGDGFEIRELNNITKFLELVLLSTRLSISKYNMSCTNVKFLAESKASDLQRELEISKNQRHSKTRFIDQNLSEEELSQYFIVNAKRFKPSYKSIMKIYQEIMKKQEKFNWEKFYYDDRNDVENVELRISKNFEIDKEGTSCKVYKCLDRSDFTRMIMKLPKEKLSEQKQIEYVKNRQFQGLLACILTRIFRVQCVSFKLFPPLSYVLPIRYELEQPFNGCTHIYAEIEIDCEQWTKFTNNAGYSINNFYPTISHFTYETTRHVFMLTDIQGEGIVLSDPAFHSKPRQLIKDRTNLGKEELDQFHIYAVDPKDRQYELLQIELSQDTLVLMLVCDICAEISSKTYGQVKKEIQEDGNQLLCSECTKIYKLFKEKNCKRCKKRFKYNKIYWREIDCSVPDLCKGCEKEKKECKKKGKRFNDIDSDNYYGYHLSDPQNMNFKSSKCLGVYEDEDEDENDNDDEKYEGYGDDEDVEFEREEEHKSEENHYNENEHGYYEDYYDEEDYSGSTKGKEEDIYHQKHRKNSKNLHYNHQEKQGSSSQVDRQKLVGLSQQESKQPFDYIPRRNAQKEHEEAYSSDFSSKNTSRSDNTLQNYETKEKATNDSGLTNLLKQIEQGIQNGGLSADALQALINKSKL
eukprot:403370239